MHVVLSGYFGFDNVGDEAILYSIIRALRSEQPTIDITVLSNNPELTRKTYEVHAVSRWKLPEINRIIKNSDALISGGGSLLQDKTGLRTIPYYLGLIELAKWHKKPVFIYAQGMGPVKQHLNKLFVRKTLNKVDIITVRDEISKTLLEKIGVRKSIAVVPDPVLGLDGNNFENDWVSSQQFSKDFITVSVRNWPTDKPFKEKIAKCLDQLAQTGYSIVFVPLHGDHDKQASEDTAVLMKKKSYISPVDASIGETIALIGKSKLLIGMRLHSLIFSAVNYTPFIAISYDPKIDAFASICEQPTVGHVENDNWDELSLLDQVNHVLANEENLQSELSNKVITLQREALETPKLLFLLLEE